MTFIETFKPSSFIYRYDGGYTGIDTLIYIDGYYKSKERQAEIGGTYHSALMFYRDGLVCYIISDNPWKTFRDKIYTVNSWGSYKIMEDTIKCQFIARDFMAGIHVSSRNYLIISKNEIMEISNVKNGVLHLYHPLENRIDSTEWNWLLKKKWFWDKKTWKNRKKE